MATVTLRLRHPGDVVMGQPGKEVTVPASTPLWRALEGQQVWKLGMRFEPPTSYEALQKPVSELASRELRYCTFLDPVPEWERFPMFVEALKAGLPSYPPWGEQKTCPMNLAPLGTWAGYGSGPTEIPDEDNNEVRHLMVMTNFGGAPKVYVNRHRFLRVYSESPHADPAQVALLMSMDLMPPLCVYDVQKGRITGVEGSCFQ